jgi:hypothetical protein
VKVRSILRFALSAGIGFLFQESRVAGSLSTLQILAKLRTIPFMSNPFS